MCSIVPQGETLCCRTKVLLEPGQCDRNALPHTSELENKLMKTASILVALSCACLLAACETTSVSVATNHDPAGKFGTYKTYALSLPKSGQNMSATSEAALRNALRAEMAKRGISEAPASQANLVVARHVFVQGKLSVQQYTDWGYIGRGGWPYGSGYYSMWPGAPVAYTDVSVYDEGTLILDFVDRKTKKLVFRGVGKAVADGPDANAAKISEAVAKIVAEYPQT